MTVIVADSEGMASDSAWQNGEIVFTESAKKIFRINGCLVGMAGSCGETTRLISLLKESELPPVEYLTREAATLSFQSAYLLILTSEGLWKYDGIGTPYALKDEFTALGSGGALAQAAMMGGASLKEAVKIAIELDTQSNGKIRYMKL